MQFNNLNYQKYSDVTAGSLSFVTVLHSNFFSMVYFDIILGK